MIETKNIETVDIAKLYAGMQALNNKILELEKMPIFRQVDGAKEVMNATRDTLAAGISVIHQAIKEIQRLKFRVFALEADPVDFQKGKEQANG